MAKKYKKIWASKEERDAYEAALDERIARTRALLEKAQAEIDAKKAAQANASPHSGGTTS